MAEHRDQWKSNTVFVLASIGAAIGLGNVWRFPGKCYEHGGGAFLVAYVFALFTAAIPLLIMEFGLGNLTQRSAPGAFRKMRRGLEWVGWWTILIGFVIAAYYVVVMAWCVDYFGLAFTKGWGTDTRKFFNEEFLGLTGEVGVFRLGGFRWPIVLGLVISWVLIVACIWKGATTVGKVVWVTVMVPWAVLLVLVWRGVTLDGAWDGLKLYLIPDWGKLLSYRVWMAAYGQVFYSVGVGFGIMIAYSSFMPRRSNLVRNAFVIAIADAMTAVVAGFAVFGAVGHLAFKDPTLAVDKVVGSGLTLAFVAYPELINNLPAGGVFLGVLFFLMLITLAIDSAFALTEAVCAGVRDKWGLSHMTANLTVAGAGLVCGLIFCTAAGLLWLDIVDHFVEFFGMCAACLVEVAVLAAYFKARKMREYVNSTGTMKVGKWWDVCLVVVTPVALGLLIIAETVSLIRRPYGDYPQLALWIGGWGLYLALPVVAFAIASSKGSGDADAGPAPSGAAGSEPGLPETRPPRADGDAIPGADA